MPHLSSPHAPPYLPLISTPIVTIMTPMLAPPCTGELESALVWAQDKLVWEDTSSPLSARPGSLKGSRLWA